MKIWYDTEFHERGANHPIELISIGMVREDGAEYYACNKGVKWFALFANEWLRENVLANLPGKVIDYHNGGGTFEPDRSEVWKHRTDIAADIVEFCAEGIGFTPYGPADRAQLYAWYADYDHVVLSQLFGRMIDLPKHMPMYTRDVKQMVDMLAPDLRFAQQEGTEHNALDDARDCRAKWLALDAHLTTLGSVAPWDIHL